MRNLGVLVAAGALLLLVACAAPASTPGLADTAWRLSGLSFDNPTYRGIVPAAEQGSYTLAFNADGTFSGTADCNQIAGTWESGAEGAITITPGPSTLAFCPGDSYGTLYANALGLATTYEIDGDALTLTFESGGGLQFVAQEDGAASPAPAASDPPAASGESVLTGATWQLTSISREQPPFAVEVSADQRSSYTIEFAADGSASAQADCNVLLGTYAMGDPAATSGDLTLTGGASTLAACPEGSLADIYVAGLAGVTGYTVEDGTLTLDGDGGTLVFEQATE